MRISGFGTERIDDGVRASARMTWEDCDRPPSTIFFETRERDGRDVVCNPHAFLVGCTVPALQYGERRIHLDAALCPVLSEGLTTAVSILHDWYFRGKRPPLQIEASAMMRGPADRVDDRAGFFFSGGVDSYATLRLNRLNYPVEHPRSIKEGVLAFGLEQDDPIKFEHVRACLQDAADACGISLVPVYTNVYQGYREEDSRHRFAFWLDAFEGSAFASIAHSLTQRLSVISISSSLSHRTLFPSGSHPLLDVNYSSSNMTIVHAGITLSRLEKTRLLVDWGLPLRYLRVCNRYAQYEPGALNCGECEKCIRTKLALLALGRSDALGVFRTSTVTPELIERRVHITEDYKAECYEEVLEPLTREGHRSIARAAARKLMEYRRHGAAGSKTIPRRILRRLSRVL